MAVSQVEAAPFLSLNYNSNQLSRINGVNTRNWNCSVQCCPQGIWNSAKHSVGRTTTPPRGQMGVVRCGIEDFIGGDLLGFDLGKWRSDVEKYGALAVYPPHEGGYEGKYATRLRYEGYHFLELTARGLGDVESYLTKVHAVRPAHLGRQPIARWYYPPEVDYRLSVLPPNSKGLVLWLIEAKVLSKAELQFLVWLPVLRPKVKVIAECGNWRKFVWKPLKEVAGLPADEQ